MSPCLSDYLSFSLSVCAPSEVDGARSLSPSLSPTLSDYLSFSLSACRPQWKARSLSPSLSPSLSDYVSFSLSLSLSAPSELEGALSVFLSVTFLV